MKLGVLFLGYGTRNSARFVFNTEQSFPLEIHAWIYSLTAHPYLT